MATVDCILIVTVADDTILIVETVAATDDTFLSIHTVISADDTVMAYLVVATVEAWCTVLASATRRAHSIT
jgi:hypothetical protein